MLQLEWDEAKAKANERKHDVTFAEAATVFANPLAAIFDDDVHSAERREIIIGHSEKHRLLVISFVERPPALRIISARKATANERKEYEDHAL